MPLKCLRGEDEVYAFSIETDEAWDALRKTNASAKDLRMPCCGAAVVLRTSKLGTRHFAHARRGPCTTAPESAEHLLAKMAIIEGIRMAGWTAMPEQSGCTPNGEDWRADVLAVKGKVKVAFEVQWSRQDTAETHRRQERYTAAGVRGMWLFRQADFPLGKDTPSFRLLFDDKAKSFRVAMPSPRYQPSWLGRDKNEGYYWKQVVDLPRFVAGALAGRLRFAPALGQRMPLVVEAAFTQCWRCHKDTRIVTGLTFAASRVLPGHADIPSSIYQFGDSFTDGAKVLMALLPASLLRNHDIGALKPRYSKTERRAYLSNGCVHCDALQGRFFDHEAAWEGEDVLEVEAEFRADWGRHEGHEDSHVFRWWFDEREPVG